jgi:tetratricopeptide (TPR) repeat protein
MILRIIISAILIAFLLIACSSKEGIVLEDETPESLILKAQAAHESGNYEEALKINQMILDNYPTSDMHIDAQLLMAKSLGKQEKFEEQFDLLLRVLKENIIPEKVPLIYMQIADYYERAASWNPGNVTSDTADLRQAANYYRRAVFYPNSDDRDTKAAALYRAALMYAKINDLETAKKAYAQVIETYPESPYSGLAKIKLLDPGNTEEIIPEAPTAGTEPVEEEITPIATPEYEEQAPLLPDTLGFELPSEDESQPAILDSVQALPLDSLQY